MESTRSMVWGIGFGEDSQLLVLPWRGRVRLRGRLVLREDQVEIVGYSRCSVQATLEEDGCDV